MRRRDEQEMEEKGSGKKFRDSETDPPTRCATPAGLEGNEWLVARTDLDYVSNFTSFGLGAVPG
jgi:hypothetical protein